MKIEFLATLAGKNIGYENNVTVMVSIHFTIKHLV